MCSRKTEQFKSYFNLYGLFHLALPLFINSMLLYNLMEHGFEMMSVGVCFAFFTQIVMVCFFAELLSGHVRSSEKEKYKWKAVQYRIGVQYL